MTAETLAGQKRALDAAATIARLFPHLPAAVIQSSHIYPGQLDVSVHDSLDHFEAWRAALGILPEWADQGSQPGSMVLTAKGRFAGVEVKLVGYAPLLEAVA
ncbi:hypothetical protein ACFYOY_13445 [Streptomyces sp. NPDC007875]|uniref:hypothetical protein n=1 Tax=Streptomyces sp. NPDC007875 TaxID=3364783 RepID=UPI0036CA4965